MLPFFYFHDNWFDWEENYWDLKILCLNQLNKHPRPSISKNNSCWNWCLLWWTGQFLDQIIHICVTFISIKFQKKNFKKRKEWYLVSLTSNISAKISSNCIWRGCFEIVRTSRFQNWPLFWKLSKICGSNRAKQNITNSFPPLY